MSWALVGSAAIGAVVSYKNKKDAKKAADKAEGSQNDRDKQYYDYLERMRDEPVRMQAWNPLEYAQGKDRLAQDDLRRQVSGTGMLGGLSHFGSGSLGKTEGGTISYDPATGSVFDAFKNSGYLDAIKNRMNYKPADDILDFDERYTTEGIKPGEVPDWAVGFKPKPPEPDPLPEGAGGSGLKTYGPPPAGSLTHPPAGATQLPAGAQPKPAGPGPQPLTGVQTPRLDLKKYDMMRNQLGGQEA